MFNQEDTPHFQPWYNFDLKDEKKLLKALKKAQEELEDYQEEHKQIMLQHLGLYKGIHMEQGEVTKRKDRLAWDTLGQATTTRFKKVVVNHLRDVTDSAVARLATFKPAATVIPNHSSEFSDKAKAKVTKAWLDSYGYEYNIDSLRRRVQLHAFIFGESYVHVCWDETKGELIKEIGNSEKMGKAIKITDENGEEHSVSRAERIGDVGLSLILPFKIYLEPVSSSEFCDVNWLIQEDEGYVTDLKLEYPDKKSKIKPSGESANFKHALLEDKDKEKVKVYTLWHRQTRELPNGLKIKFTPDVVLETGDLPYSHGRLPFVRLTALDVPGELNGMSPYLDLKSLQESINNLYSVMIRDRSLAAPKLMIPAGTVDSNQNATNRPGVIQYKGGVPPTWSVPNLVSSDITVMIDRLERTFEKLSNSLGTRRGDSLPNVEAFKAFGFFEEQATKRDSTQIAKHRTFLEDLYKQILWVAGDFYSNDDERMIKIIGKHNRYLLKSFDVEDLTKSYDIRVQNTSSLPDSKGQRIQTVIELNQAFPDLFTKEKIADMLDLSTPDAFFDQATAAINAAEQENEEMLAGTEVREPQAFEDLLLHWETHFKQFSDPTVKETLPEDPQEVNLLLDTAINGPVDLDVIIDNPYEDDEQTLSPAILLAKHLHITEGLIFERALKNPTFAKSLLDKSFAMFPVFFEMPLTVSEIVAQHEAPMLPPAQQLAPSEGIEQQIELPGVNPNPNDLLS